MTASSKLLL